MIRQTKTVPTSMQYLMVKKHTYYEATMAGERYATMAIRPVKDECQFHIQFQKFNHKIWRQFLFHDWILMRIEIKNTGCKHIIGIFENHNDKKMLKFISKLGFNRPKILALTSMEA
jgi:hypothetical protein